MKSHASWTSDSHGLLDDLRDFSLVLGGPLFQLLRRAHLSDNALKLVRQRTILISLFAWLPLAVLAAMSGNLLGRSGDLSFLRDAEFHVRFLVAMPLLIIAELVVHQRLAPLLKEFLQRKLIPDDALPRFHRAIVSALRLRNSVIAEVVLIVIVYVVGITLVWRHFVALNTVTWYAKPSADGPRLSFAGIWYGYVSLPIFQFLLLRWYFRMFIWTRFLWQVSRIRLHVIPTHPDRVGGLNFLADSVYAFGVLAVAHGALVAGHLANRIFFLGARLTQFKAEIAVVGIFMLCAVLGPLLLFAPQLGVAKRKGLLEYGSLAMRYMRGFDVRWLRGGARPNEAFMGSPDIQSLADMGTSFEVVRNMRLAPISKDAVLRLAAATLLPIAPLVLTLMPLEELLKKLLTTLF